MGTNKVDPLKYIGMNVKANNGQLMTVIAYRNYSDIDVQFEDGTLVCHKSMGAFKKGQITNPNFVNTQCVNKAKVHIGEKCFSLCGQYMIIVEYINSKNIIVEFEDGTRVKTTYSDFNRGQVGNPNFTYFDKCKGKRNDQYIGKSKKMSNGLMLTITDYDHYDYEQKKHFYKGKFDDGAECVFELSRFNSSIVGHPSMRSNFTRNRDSREGMIFKTNQGLSGEIISYFGTHKVKYRLETGKEGFTRFNKLESLVDLDYDKKCHIGEVYDTCWGISATITDYINKDKVVAKLDDGCLINTNMRVLRGGMVRQHPYLSCNKNKTFNYLSFLCKFACKMDSDLYYECKCLSCGDEDILSVKEMLGHFCVKRRSCVC